MKISSHIVISVILIGAIACNSSDQRNQSIIDPGVKILNARESLEYIDNLLEEDPNSADLLLKKAEILYDLNLFEEAYTVLMQIKKSYKNIDYQILDIKLRQKNDQVDEALAKAEYLYNTQKIETNDLNEQLAYLYAEKRDYLKAIDHINICIDKDRGNPKYAYLKGLYYYNFKDTLNSYLYLEKALNDGYEEMEGIILYAELLLAYNKSDEALEWVRNYLQKEPGNERLNNTLAKVYNLRREYNLSKEISLDMMRKNYQGYEPLLNLADIYLDTYKYDSAIYFAESALTINGQVNDIYYVLGKAHRAKEEVYMAYNAYSKVLEFDPGDPFALTELRKLENYIAYLQRIKREYESRPVVPTLKPKSIDQK